ncbi:MAG: T9SS type A sorting domain-containing protein [Candidatus Delongbacteria bacterium]
MSKRLLFALLGTLAFGPAAFPAVFTGVVPTDFNGTDVVSVPDPLGDVSVPTFNAPPGTVPGWDMTGASFELNRTTGVLAVGLDFFGVAGDADGDGIDGFTSPWLAQNGGADYADLANSEAICIAFDFDQDGTYDVIAGDSFFGTATGIGVSAFSYLPFGLPTCFGAPLPANYGGHFYSPFLASPDFEIALSNFGDFEDLNATTICFNFQVFAGANWDDGIGEDVILGEACFTDDGQVEAQPLPTSPDLIRAFPNPFNPTTTLAVELAETGHVELAIFNLQGQQVASLVNGSLSAGSHQVAFHAGNLPSGLYLARLSTVSGQQVSRLVLTK